MEPGLASLPRAFGWAAAAHVLVALAVRAVPVARPSLAVDAEPSIELTREVANAAPERPGAAAGAAEPARGPRPSAATPTGAPRAASIASDAAPVVATGATGEAAWFDPVRHPPTQATLLDRRVELSTSPPTERTQRNDGAVAAVRDALAAHDQSLGLGRAGPLQAAAHEAASAAIAPDTGVGQLEIVCDGEGRVVSVRALQSPWQPVATRLARVMAGQTVRVRPGSRGLRVALRIVAERTLPSGERGATSPGAVPDDACDGEGLTRRCVAGLPLGVTSTQQDLSNTGARPARVVHVNVDRETDL